MTSVSLCTMGCQGSKLQTVICNWVK
nr:hypothetical protein [Enterococcus moraviensis]